MEIPFLSILLSVVVSPHVCKLQKWHNVCIQLRAVRFLARVTFDKSFAPVKCPLHELNELAEWTCKVHYRSILLFLLLLRLPLLDIWMKRILKDPNNGQVRCLSCSPAYASQTNGISKISVPSLCHFCC